MEKRLYERVESNLKSRFFYGNMFFAGTIENISEKGMFISSDTCLPEGSFFVVILREGEKLIKVIAKVKRNCKTEDVFDGMGVELLSPSKSYLEYVDNLKVAVH